MMRSFSLRSLWTLLPSVLILILLCGGCDGDGDMPPVISNITPTGAIGVPDQTVVFSATVTGTGPFTYTWDFDGGADPDPSTDPSPTVTLKDVGTYSASLTVTGGDSSFTTVPFEFEVEALPEIQNITPTGNVGRPLKKVTFEAEVTGFVESYKWEFEGGAEPSISTAASPEVALQEPGTYTGSLTVFADGEEVETRPFSYEVEVATAPAFGITRVGPQSSGGFNQPTLHICLVAHDGRLAMAYNSPDGGIVLARAKSATPTGCCDWEQHVIDPAGFLRSSRALVSIAGRLALLYAAPPESGEGHLWLAISSVEEPQSESDWLRYQLTEDFTDDPWSMILVEDRLRVLSTIMDSGTQKLSYWSADIELPESGSDWTNTPGPESLGGGGFKHMMLTNIGSTIQAITLDYNDSGFGGFVALYQSDSLTPAGPENWRATQVSSDNASSSGRVADLIEDDGKVLVALPVIAAGSARPLTLAKALTAEPASAITDAAEWTTVILSETSSDNLGLTSLARSSERLLVGAAENHSESALLVRQTGATVTTLEAWEPIPIESGLGFGGGAYAVVCDLDGRPAIAYSIPAEGAIGVAVALDEY